MHNYEVSLQVYSRGMWLDLYTSRGLARESYFDTVHRVDAMLGAYRSILSDCRVRVRAYDVGIRDERIHLERDILNADMQAASARERELQERLEVLEDEKSALQDEYIKLDVKHEELKLELKRKKTRREVVPSNTPGAPVMACIASSVADALIDASHRLEEANVVNPTGGGTKWTAHNVLDIIMMKIAGHEAGLVSGVMEIVRGADFRLAEGRAQILESIMDVVPPWYEVGDVILLLQSLLYVPDAVATKQVFTMIQRTIGYVDASNMLKYLRETRSSLRDFSPEHTDLHLVALASLVSRGLNTFSFDEQGLV